ncbi:MAG: MBL fold metallo-hydrolase, partial [Chloroflexota bacterium]
VYVHEVGAPHLISPEKLLASAGRIYGDQMETLWGAFEPVPEANIHPLSDLDEIAVGGRTLVAHATPGHASHHIAFQEPHGGLFAGDVAGVRLQGLPYVRPPTPPPELDLALWEQSLDRVAGLRPNVLYLTHFGPFTDVEPHVAQTRERLRQWDELLSSAQEAGQSRDDLVTMLRQAGDREIQQATAEGSAVDRYELATPYGMTVDGYLRLFRRRARV